MITPTGLGKYSYYLLKELLKNQNYIFKILHQANLPDTHPLFKINKENVTFIPMDIPTIGPKRELMIFNLRKKIYEYDIFHCLSSYLPAFGIRIPSIVTIHDLKYLLFPAFFKNRFKTVYYNLIVRKGIRSATSIIAVSEATKRDLEKMVLWSEKISVISEASTISLSGSNNDLPDELTGKSYVLFVGENRPHKNILRLIEAYNKILNKLGESCPFFVIAGSKFRDLKEKSKCNKIIFCGSVSEKKLVNLYKHAIALVYPSLYEGFGLPILEAMTMGTPVITSDCSSMPEVAGGAALFVDPYNTNQIAGAILKIVQDKSERRRLSNLSIQRSKSFSWRQKAQLVEVLYTKILSCKDH